MMKDTAKTPLLLLDDTTMHVLGNGTYRIQPMSFEDARYTMEVYPKEDVLKCYTDRTIDQVIHDYIGIVDKDFTYKKIRQMRPGQMAIVFKRYITASESQPVVQPEPGAEAKKIQNVYVYCECITCLEMDTLGYTAKA